jgi:hypothetical protein
MGAKDGTNDTPAAVMNYLGAVGFIQNMGLKMDDYNTKTACAAGPMFAYLRKNGICDPGLPKAVAMWIGKNSNNLSPTALLQAKTLHIHLLNVLRAGCATTPITMASFDAMMASDDKKNIWNWLGPLIGVVVLILAVLAFLRWRKMKKVRGNISARRSARSSPNRRRSAR